MANLYVKAQETPSFERPDLLEGTINKYVAGKTVDGVYTDGKFLLLALTNGQLIKIKWVKDSPVLHSVDVRVLIQGVEMEGIAKL